MITIGRIVRPHGRQGEVRVIPMADVRDRFCYVKRVHLSEGGEDRAEVENERVRCARHDVILKLKGVDTFQDAERLRDKYILIRRSDACPLPEGHYYIFEVIGLEVMTDRGARIGRVEDVMKLKSNDVYVVRGEKGEVLIPAIKEIVKKIDTKNGRMVVRPMKGLLD